MPDLLGYRAKIGIVVPSTNTTMEPDMHAMAPPGVTFHTVRLRLAQSAIRTAEETKQVIAALQDALAVAVQDLMTAAIDHLINGVSALSFMGGVSGGQRHEEYLKTLTTAPISTASSAVSEALEQYAVKRIGIVSPHPAMFDEHYVRFFSEKDMKLQSSTALNVRRHWQLQWSMRRAFVRR